MKEKLESKAVGFYFIVLGTLLGIISLVCGLGTGAWCDGCSDHGGARDRDSDRNYPHRKRQ